jgi:hypothetical protein
MNHLSFDLSVIGTANKPTSVRCVLGRNPTASFEAYNKGTSTWYCDVDLPLHLHDDELPFKVEVLINGRLFSPLSTTLKVDKTPKFDTKIEEPVQEPEAPEVVELPDVPVQFTATTEATEAVEPEPIVEEQKPIKDDKEKVAEALTKIFEAPIKPVPTAKPKTSMFAQIDEMAGAKAPEPKVETKPKPRRVSIPESRPNKVVVHVTKGPIVYK